MRFPAALLLCSLAAFAQTPPPEVDQALRARVNEFYGYHVSGDFDKAWPMVADDTKKEYFGAQKIKYDSFKIDSIKYLDDFTKAEVTLTVSETKRLGVQFPATVFTYQSKTSWKIENGKWCWYNDPNQAGTANVMPFGASDPKAIEEAKKRSATAPAITEERLQQMAKGILGQSGLDKAQLKLSGTKASSDQAVFKNGQGGWIKIGLMQEDLPAGMKAALDKNDVGPADQATLKVSYTPTGTAKPPASVTLKLVMEPFSRVFPVMVIFDQGQ